MAQGGGTDNDRAALSRRLAFRFAVVVMALLSVAKLTDELVRLVWRADRIGAIDLKLRYEEVHAWFAGTPVYGALPAPTYPPAAYATLWPFLGWMPLGAARWLWAATTIAALVWMTRIVVRESGARDAWSRAFVALMLLAMNQTGVAVGNGQLILVVLPVLVVGLLLIHNGRATWAGDFAAATCILFAMVKVTLAVPFLWLVVFAPALGPVRVAWPWRLRPALLVAIGYVVLTLFAASFQSGSVLQLLRGWMEVAQTVSVRGGDYANLSAWLIDAGLVRLVPLVSIAVFVALGMWLYRFRDVDLWVRLGVVAIVTRFWAYHRLYDDVLIILALVTLCRIVSSSRVGAAATALIATTVLFMLLPARMGTSPAPWQQIFNVTHIVTWLGSLTLLAWYAATESRPFRPSSRTSPARAP